MNIGQKSFHDSLLFRWQLSGGTRGELDEKCSLVQVFGEEGRVIVNSRSVNRRKIRSEWFEFLSRETNGRRDSRILMCHAKGAKVACFLYSLALAFYSPGLASRPNLTSRIWEVNREASRAASYSAFPLSRAREEINNM